MNGGGKIQISQTLQAKKAPEIQRRLDPKHEQEIDIETKNIASRKINRNMVETQFLNITDLLIRTTVN